MHTSPSILLKNATIFDGAGGDSHCADVLIRDTMIVAVQPNLQLDGARVIDLSGLALCPGFIDLHTHSDVSLMRDGRAESQLLQGVTTEVVGNCGHSPAPLRRAQDAQSLTFGPRADADPCWRSFAQFLDALAQAQPAVNVAALVGHGALRLACMDDPLQAATAQEIQAMVSLLHECLDEGAVGLSTGLEYVPGLCAETQELNALCKAIAKQDRLYATHIRNRDTRYKAAMTEALNTARYSQTRLQVSHMTPKYGAPPGTANHMLEMIDQARREGVDAAFDVIPSVWGPTAVSSVLPAWVFEGGISQALQRLRDPLQREKIKANPNPIWQLVLEGRWQDIVLFGSQANAQWVGLPIAEIATIKSSNGFDTVLDLLCDEGEAFGSLAWVGRNFSEADTQNLLTDGYAGVISDAITISRDGAMKDLRWSPSAFGWTARFLQHHVRERRHLNWQEGIYRLTQLPAKRLRLKDRSCIRPGYKADLVAIDQQKIADVSTLAHPNVPPSGITYVWVNGQLAAQDGKLTGIRVGQIVKG